LTKKKPYDIIRVQSRKERKKNLSESRKKCLTNKKICAIIKAQKRKGDVDYD